MRSFFLFITVLLTLQTGSNGKAVDDLAIQACAQQRSETGRRGWMGGSLSASPDALSQESQKSEVASAEKNFGSLPLYFIENQGQLDDEVAYYVKGSDKTLYFTSRGITFVLKGKRTEAGERWVLALDFIDANPGVEPNGQDRQKTVFSYFKGKPGEWKTGISTYCKLVYSNLWPGIDLIYSGGTHELKYEFIVRPGSNPEKIRLAYRGASAVSLKDTGGLQINTPVSNIDDSRPYAYQIIDGATVEVPVFYAPKDLPKDGKYIYGFDIDDYDQNESLILDPAVLVYCGYIGGTNMDSVEGIAVDEEGNAYVVGSTCSDERSFPVKIGPDLTYNDSGSVDGFDVFVAKISADGKQLEYCGYIGGDDVDTALNIGVDSLGNAYVAGETLSSPLEGFPVLIGPDLSYNGGYDVFVAKVSADGTHLEYCGYIGGAGTDWSGGLDVDCQGCSYIGGTTGSSELTFPVTIGPDLSYNDDFDAFVAKVSADGTHLEYCGYIGGSNDMGDVGTGIAVDSIGSAYVVGSTFSDESSFPVTVGPDLTYNGGMGDCFVAKVNVAGTHLDYCGYIGGQGYEGAWDIAVDSGGNAYITGFTDSSEGELFPLLIGPDLFHNGGKDAFVAKITTSGEHLDYCGYIGGILEDRGRGIAVDSLGSAYVTGYTKSTQSTFPVLGSLDLTYNGPKDGFVLKINSKGSALEYCGYVGGESLDYGEGIAVDTLHNVYIGGRTMSPDFPIIAGPDFLYNGEMDGFVAKISEVSVKTTKPRVKKHN